MEELVLELEARPSMRDWTEQRRMNEDLELKVRDLTILRGEAAEISNWRKHLSTADRIRIDKRNHELGLWLFDSLPKTVMKDTLQMICRELDCTELSEISNALLKLKAVVKTVPRMERFISQVCTFVFERDQQRHGGSVPNGDTAREGTMESVLPALKR